MMLTPAQELALSLQMRAKWIEIGSPALSSLDATVSGRRKKVKKLQGEEVQLIVYLRQLAADLLDGRLALLATSTPGSPSDQR